jgi:hypothetical protein
VGLAGVDEDDGGAQTSTPPTRRRGEPDGRQEWPELEPRWPARKTMPSSILLFYYFIIYYFFFFSFSFFHFPFIFLIFNWLTSGPFYPCQQAYFFFANSALTVGSHPSDLASIRSQFTISANCK